MQNKPILNTILLHICCGPCAAWPIQKLREDGQVPIGYFYNPNIHPEEEYLKRLEAAKKIARSLEFELIEGPYDPDAWLESVKGFEEEKEGGARCGICFSMRLEGTYKKSKELGIESFTSTLSVSPHKDVKSINKSGKEAGGKCFMEYDFKKDNGFKKSRDAATHHKLYCQKYCGCMFSQKP